jgi:autotransporter-associated beta strand protein
VTWRPWPPGNYPLLVAGTALFGDDSNFELVAPASRLASYDLLHDAFSVTQAVYLTVAAGGSPSNLTWKGSAAQWDVVQTTNWLNGVGDDAFYQGDFVTFDATGVAESNVNLTALLAPGSVTVDSSGGGYRLATTNGGRLTGSAALAKLGAGALVVETANDYTGGTAIEAGALILDPGGLPGAGPITNQGELVLNGADLFTLSNVVSGAGVLVQRSTGRVVVAVDQAYSGGTRIEAGELQIGTGGAAGSAGTGGVTNQGLLVFNRSDALAPAYTLSGTGVVRKLGAQMLTLSQQSDFTGPLQVSNGAVLVTATGALGTAAAGVTVANNTTLGLSGGLAGLPAEPLQIHGPGALGAGYFFPGSAIQRGALQSVSGSNEWAGPIQFDGTGGNTRIGVQDGAVLVLRGAITESVAGSSLALRHGGTAGSDIILAGPGQWTGPSLVFGGGGAVKLGADDRLPTGAVLRVGASGIPGESRFDLNGFDQAVAGLGRAGEGPARVINDGPAASVLTLHAASNIIFYGAVDGGTGGLSVIKRGPAVQAFGSNCQYAGATVIEEGALELLGSGAISNSATVSIHAAAALVVTARPDRAFTVSPVQTLQGGGAVSGNVVNAGRAEPGLSAGTLSISGSYTQETLGTLAVEIGGPLPGIEHDVLAVGDQAALDGFLDVAFTGGYTGTPGQVFTVLTAVARSGTFAFTNLPALGAGLAWTVAYEPAAVVLSISGGSPAPTPYEVWADAIPNPALRGDQEDADGDGYANLWEYSQGTDPTNSAAGATITLVRTGGVYALKFNRATGAVDVIYQVEAAGVPTNNAAWAGVASNVFGAGWTGPASVSETNSGAIVQAFAADPDPLATNRTLRLRVIRP